MKREKVKEIIASLGKERRVFRYFKDRYCLDLIGYEMERQSKPSIRASELKRGSLSRFTHKRVVANALSACGNGEIRKNDLEVFWPTDLIPFVLTLGSWGAGERGWDQTSRNQCNLVLQVNFDGAHAHEYTRLVKPDNDYGPFESWCHPVRQVDRKTMSWVRMDIDFDSNEALIEEIQNDWLRKAIDALIYLRKRRTEIPSIKPNEVFGDIHGEYEDLEYYVERTLAPYKKIWAEASMLAAIEFIRRDLGISTIYYHSLDTGKKIKRVWGAPPRSMYTQLPKQFGFELTAQTPEFLARDKFSRRCIKAIKEPRWYCMAT